MKNIKIIIIQRIIFLICELNKVISRTPIKINNIVSNLWQFCNNTLSCVFLQINSSLKNSRTKISLQNHY